MKKVYITIAACLGVILVLYFTSPYEIKTVCFGDVCPDNGGTFLLYKHAYSEEGCASVGGEPIVGFGWTRVYAGCSPNNFMSWLVEKLNN